MRYTITGMNMNVTPGLREDVIKKIGKLERYFNDDTEAVITLSVEKERQKIEVTIPVKGTIIRAEQVSDDIDLLCFGFIWKGRGYAAPIRKGGSLWPAVWNKAWRRTAIGDTRFPTAYPDDWFFHVDMMNKNLRIKAFDMPLYYYNYWRPGSVSYERERDLRIYKYG